MVWTLDGSQGFESAKIAHLAVFYTRGSCLDVGCGMKKVWPSLIGVDAGVAFGHRTDAQIIRPADKLDLFADASMDGVFSSHTLEHVVDWKATLKEWWRVIKPKGFLTLYLPHKNFYPNIGQPGSNPDHKHDFLPEDIVEGMREVAAESGFTIMENEERGQGNEYSFFQVFEKRTDGQMVDLAYRKTEGKKSVLVIRYGAIGDGVQTASVLKALYDEGYEVHLNTVPTTHEILALDPHVDAFWLQAQDQVPNPELGAYWEQLRQEGRWDRIVNLCESVEGELLALPGRIRHAWPEKLRREVCGVNYLERMHDIAEVSKERLGHAFYPSEDEKLWAERERFRLAGGRPFIVWALIGSALHKVYPHADVVANWIAKNTDAVVAFVSDPGAGKELQDKVIKKAVDAGADPERIYGAAGLWKIRQAITMAQRADIVIGPETGLINAVGFEANRKIVFLSHSSPENLTKHWRNTAPLYAKALPCWPCHRMHYDWSTCRKDEATAAAMCAASITPDTVFREVRHGLAMMQRKRAA